MTTYKMLYMMQQMPARLANFIPNSVGSYWLAGLQKLHLAIIIPAVRMALTNQRHISTYTYS